MSTCATDGCDRTTQARGLCNTHYHQLWRAGGINPPALADRFWAKVEKGDGCWIWTGARTALGYGQIRAGGPVRYAHRVSYELARGEIPEGLDIDHLCRNTSCVNPEHLEPVTHRENVLRGTSPMAQQARMTVCGKGLHSLANAYVSGGKRTCRECKREWERARYRSKGSAA